MTTPQDDAQRYTESLAQIVSVPTILQVLREVTGMGTAGIGHADASRFTICAIVGAENSNLRLGSCFNIETTPAALSRRSGAPVMIEHSHVDREAPELELLRAHGLESYVSVPIESVHRDRLGDLFVTDRGAVHVAGPLIDRVFARLAWLISLELDDETMRARERAALVESREAGELRDRFIAILGHDLRDPLQAMFATCDALQKRFEDPYTVDLIGRMRGNAERMSALVDDVMDFAQGNSSGGLGVDLRESDDVGGGLDAVVRELQDARPDRTILSNISVQRTVHCDVRRIQQLVSNLLSNALTHGDAGSPVHFVATAERDDMIIEVWNRGEPIPQENLGKIFSPFWHAAQGRRQGLGLGLHICSQIVDAHHGEMTVSSSRENGTRFMVRLPGVH